jgi:hypothetical protein
MALGYGMKNWGEMFDRLGAIFNKLFGEGITKLRVVWDGRTPPNKSVEQQQRKDRWEGGFADGEKPYEWPKTDDGEDWFRRDDRIKCSLNNMYGARIESKRQSNR